MRRTDGGETVAGAAAPGAVSRPVVPADVLARLAAAVDDVVAIGFDRCDNATVRAVVREVTKQAGRLEGVRATAVQHVTSSVPGEMADGATSGASWLAEVTGTTPAAAVKTARLGQALDRLPTLAAAVATGAVGTEQAASIALAASRDVLDDRQLTDLVDDARRTPAGVFARHVRDTEARTDQRQLRRDEQLARQRRTATWRRTTDGSVEGSFRLDPIAGTAVVTALDALSLPDPADCPPELRRTAGQRRADALTTMAEQTLARGQVSTSAGVRPHVTVTVPVTMLEQTHGAAEQAGATGRLPDGTMVSAETARRLLCDATVRRLVLDPAGRPVDVGRATRTWSPSQRAAIEAVDGRCRGPACDRPASWSQIHHLVWWRHGGTTAIDNGLLLCGRCHDLLHHHRWTVHLDPHTRVATWTAPDGTARTTHPTGPAASTRPTDPADTSTGALAGATTPTLTLGTTATGTAASANPAHHRRR